jgi:hypothetical protein
MSETTLEQTASDLYWRSEILQAMYWMRVEGFGDRVDVPLLERFLGAGACNGVQYLDRLVEEGTVERAGERYRLSPAGARRGEMEFVASFEDLMRPAPCPRSQDCWSHAWFEEGGSDAPTVPPCQRLALVGRPTGASGARA